MAKRVRGNFSPELIQGALRQGDHNVVQMFGGGATTTGNVAVYDATGNVVDGAVAPITAGAKGTVLKSITGSTTRFQQETYSVLDFGATGNGSTDDTTACAAAITAAASGGTVVFPPGTYIVTGLTLAAANISLYLSAGATIKLKASANARVLTITANGCRVEGDGIVDGNQAAQGATSNCQGIYINASGVAQTLTGVVVSGITVQSTVNAGIMLAQTGSGASCLRCTVEHTTVQNIGSASRAAIAEGIALYGPSQCLIDGNIVSATANHGIVSTEGSDNSITNNRILNPGANFNNGFAHCVAVDGNGGSNRNTGNSAIGNYCENARDHGIEFADGTDRVVIVNNVVNGTSASHGVGGIYFGGALAYSEYATILGNQVFDVIGSGIIVEGPSSVIRSAHAAVCGNVVLNASQHGIYLHNADEGSCSDNVVMNSSQGSSGTYDGLRLNNYDRWAISANRIGDNQGSPTQNYGINFATLPSNVTVAGENVLLPEKTAAINYAAGSTGLTIQNNPGVTNIPATGGAGTVTSVSLTMPLEFSATGSPITTSGTFVVSKQTQAANLVYAGPGSGGVAQPTFRALVSADLPAGAGSPLTTKGDVYTYASANARLPVGTDGQVLTANAAATNGIDWETVAFRSLTTTGTSGAATLTAGVLNIPQYTGGGGTTHSESLTDGASNFIFAGGDIVTVVGVPN